MAMAIQHPERKLKYRRETRFAPGRTIPFLPEVDAALVAEADAAETSVAAIVREAVERGLRLVRDSRRKRKLKPEQHSSAA